MKCELRLYPPSSTDFHSIQPTALELDQAANYPAQLTASVPAWDSGEDDAANPLQRGAYVEYWEDATCLFRGKVKHVAHSAAGGQPQVTLTALDKLQVLAETFALHGGQYIWSRQTPPLALSNITLYAGHDYGDGLRFVWWPDPGSSAWLSIGASSSSMIASAMTNISPASGSRLKLSQQHSGLPPAGFISIGSEWIEYNGYAWDPADGYWYAHNVQRASLGTAAATHSAGATAYSRLSKRIDPRGRIKLEGLSGGTWELVQLQAHCAPQWESGGFAFAQDPAALGSGGATYSAVRATYSLFDEEGGSALKLSDVLTSVLNGDPALGGPGFDDGLTSYTDSASISVSLSPDPVLTRVVVSKKTRALEFIRGLLSELALIRGGADDAVLLRYDPQADRVVISPVGQATVPAKSYFSEAQRLEESGTGLQTAALVEYEAGTPFNLVSSRRIWHTPCGLVGSGTPPGGAVPAPFQKVGGVWHGPLALAPIGTFNLTQEIVPGVPGAANLLTDNDETSGLALLWDTLQAAGVQLYAWFPGASATAPDSYYITKLVASFDLTGQGAGVFHGAVPDLDFEFLVYDTFTGSTTTSAPTLGTPQPLSVKASVQFSAGPVNQQWKVEAEIPYVSGRAIGMRINGYLDAAFAASGFRYGFALNELAVYGVQLQQELITLTGTYASTDSATLVAADSAAKLLDVHMGQHDCAALSIGPATREVARGMGWIALLESLAQARSRTYVISSASLDREGLAQVGETAAFECAGRGAIHGSLDRGGIDASPTSPFTGVVDSATYTLVHGQRELTVRAVDYASRISGGPPVTCARLPPPRSNALRHAEEQRKSGARQRFVALGE